MKKNTTMIAILFCFALFAIPCDTFSEEKKDIPLESKSAKVSYIIGTNIAKSLLNIEDEIELDMLIEGLKDRFNKKPLRIKESEAQMIMREFSNKMNAIQKEKKDLQAKEAIEKGTLFLEKNKKKEGVITTQSGLQYRVMNPGNGPTPTKKDKVKVHYRGTTIAGVEFDSSYKRGQPAVFPVTGVIKGWTEALLLMKVGGKYQLFIPSELAYGQRGAGGNIGPNEVLIFVVELLGIEK